MSVPPAASKKPVHADMVDIDDVDPNDLEQPVEEKKETKKSTAGKGEAAGG